MCIRDSGVAEKRESAVGLSEDNWSRPVFDDCLHLASDMKLNTDTFHISRYGFQGMHLSLLGQFSDLDVGVQAVPHSQSSCLEL